MSSNLKAVIKEEACIGCTKCIQACPFDAISGAMNLMHTVISDECIGCKLCVEPCPVDCIEMIAIPEILSKEERIARATIAKKRFQHRASRLKKIQFEIPVSNKKDYIQEALLRAKNKKVSV